MQNIDVRFSATSNFAKVKADLAALRAQAAALGSVFQQNAYATQPAIVDPAKWKVATAAVHEASRVYRDAASSSGLFNTQQIRATSEAEKYTKALQKQKLSLGEMRRARGVMAEVYRDQLRMQRMTAQYWGSDTSGRAIMDITVPKNVPRELDSLANRLYFTGQMAKSAGTQIVNMGKNMQWSGRQLMVGLTYPTLMFGAAAGTMAYKADEALTRVTKVYDVSAEAARDEAKRVIELNDVRTKSWDLSKDAARSYAMAMTDTLEIEQRLAATGIAGDKLMADTKAVSRIATLGDLDIGQSTDMTIALQNAFKDTIKTAEDLTRTFDFMNAVENSTSLSLQDIARATPRAAAGMAGLGVTAEEMTVMLVAMRESGVDAAQGANALKSATTRILKPVKQATDYYEQFGISLESISKRSGGNLFEFLKMLAEEQTKIVANTEKETNRLRQKGVATLFGTYQFNRLNAALTGIGDAMAGVGDNTTQTAKAMKLMKADATALADAAEQELGDKMMAASGRFKAAWELLRVELAEIGMPFLSIGADALSAVTNLLSAFNQLDEWKKNFALIAAGVMAIVGPVVMLGGLFLNLGGQFVSGAGRILTVFGKLGGAIGLVTQEERAAALAAKAQNDVLMSQQKATSTLVQELEVLRASYERATKAAQLYTQQAMGGTAAARPQSWAPSNPQQSGLMMPGGLASSIYQPSGTGSFNTMNNAASRAEMAAKMQRETMHAQIATTRSAMAEYGVRDKIQKKMSGAAIAGGAFSAAMAASMVSSNKVVDSLAQWGMAASLVIPVLKSVAGRAAIVTMAAKAEAIERWNSVRATVTNTGAMGGLAGATRVAGAAAVGFGRALNAALGPIGWISLGLTAIAGVFMTVKNQADEAREAQEEMVRKQVEANRELMSSSESIATRLGEAAGAYEKIVALDASAGIGKGAQSRLMEAYNFYKGEEGSKQTAALQGPDGTLLATDELMDKVRTKFLDLQVIGKDSAKQARADVTAMLAAAGLNLAAAENMAEEVYMAYGDVNELNWATPIRDQIAQLDQLAAKAMQLDFETIVGGNTVAVISEVKVDEGAMDLWRVQAEKAAEIFEHALQTANSPMKARKLIKTYFDAATIQWKNGYEELVASSEVGSTKLRELFDREGVKGGKSFMRAFRDNADFRREYENLIASSQVNPALQGQMKYVAQFAQEYEKMFVNEVAKGSALIDSSVTTAAHALSQLAAQGQGLTSNQAIQRLMTTNALYLEYANIQSQIAGMDQREMRTGVPDTRRLELQNRLNDTGGKLTKTVNNLNKAYGFREGSNATEALANLMNKVSAETDDATDSAGKLENKLSGIDRWNGLSLGMKQVGGVVRDAMTAVQDEMAASAENRLSSAWDSRMDAASASWDARMEHMVSSHEKAQSAMERREEQEDRALERRANVRRRQVEQRYAGQIKQIEKRIEAERRSDEVRNRLYEREKRRLEELARITNAGIDFNTQLAEGKLDEAAKTLNNTDVETMNAQLEREEEIARRRSESRIKALEKKNQRLEKARDKEINDLERVEKRMRRHLDRVQSARRDALKKQQEAEERSLKAREEAAMKSMRRQRDYEEAMLRDRLTLFKSYVARNQRDLERWMRKVGLSYDDFGSDVRAKGERWSTYFQKSLSRHIREAGKSVMSDTLWEKVGTAMAKRLIKGLGFDSLDEFNRFIKTGRKDDKDAETRHAGGEIGSGGGSRGNIPNSYKGLHRSEKMVRAQVGEFMVNRDAAQKNREILEAINAGSDMSLGGMGFGGPGALMAAMAGTMFMAGVQKAMEGQVASAKKMTQPANDPKLGKYIAGSGGRHRPVNLPVTSGLHGGTTAGNPPALDFAGPTGLPIYAVASGRITSSRDIAGPLPTDRYRGTGPYGSFGRMVTMLTDSGAHVLYAHLSQRNVSAGQRVPGGSVIGRLGNTGNSSGSHLHFGATNGPYAWLRRGGSIKYDNTPVIAHRGETVLSERLTRQFEDNVAGRGGSEYAITIDMRGAVVKHDVDIERAVERAIEKKESKVGRKRVVP